MQAFLARLAEHVLSGDGGTIQTYNLGSERAFGYVSFQKVRHDILADELFLLFDCGECFCYNIK
jgi:hypothetical protein